MFNKKLNTKNDEEMKKSEEVSRRDFLVGAGAVLAASALGGGMLSGCSKETTTETVQVTTTKTVPTTIEVPTTVVSTVNGSGATVTETKTTTVQGTADKFWLPANWDYEADVVVVGYGGAGAVSAISG